MSWVFQMLMNNINLSGNIKAVFIYEIWIYIITQIYNLIEIALLISTFTILIWTFKAGTSNLFYLLQQST